VTTDLNTPLTVWPWPSGRAGAGVMARVAQRVLAVAIWHNWATDAPVTRSLIADDR